MARPLRIEFAGGMYHLTTRGWERREVVRDDEDPGVPGLLDPVALRFGWRVYAWALMRSHWSAAADSFPCQSRTSPAACTT